MDSVTVHGFLAMFGRTDTSHLTEKKPQRHREHREENGERPPHFRRSRVTSHVPSSVHSVFSVVNQKEHHEGRRMKAEIRVFGMPCERLLDSILCRAPAFSRTIEKTARA